MTQAVDFKGFTTLQTMSRIRCKCDKVLYYFKEVVILGPVHFISHWTWTIAFYVFYFLDFFVSAVEWLETVPEAGGARHAALSLPWSVPAAHGLNMNVQSSLQCPPRRLLQRASAEAGVLSDSGQRGLCTILLLMQNLANHLGLQ